MSNLAADDPRHGANGYNNLGCRCPICKSAKAEARRRRVASAPPDKIPHGLNGYTNYGCRCEPCRAAKSEEMRAVRERRAQEGPSHLPHGTNNGYAQWGCRCDECKQAHSADKTRRRLANNDESRKSARRAGGRWTGPELEIATRPDLTAREAAAMLGRSYIAVERARARCLHDPRYAALLGAATTGDESLT